LIAKSQNIDIGTAFIQSIQKNNNQHYWKLVINNHNIGHLGLKNIDDSSHTAEISYVIGEPSYWKKGIATDAVAGMIRHLQTIRWSSLTALVKKENIASVKLLKKHGFLKEQNGKEWLCRRTF
jgi:ribosomal-protein-alanine N-acetyltransferase